MLPEEELDLPLAVVCPIAVELLMLAGLMVVTVLLRIAVDNKLY